MAKQQTPLSVASSAVISAAAPAASSASLTSSLPFVQPSNRPASAGTSMTRIYEQVSKCFIFSGLSSAAPVPDSAKQVTYLFCLSSLNNLSVVYLAWFQGVASAARLATRTERINAEVSFVHLFLIRDRFSFFSTKINRLMPSSRPTTQICT